MEMKPKSCMAYVNHHNIGAGGQVPNIPLSQSLERIDKQVGTAEDNAFVYAGFEKYLIKLLKARGQENLNEEENMMAWGGTN